MGRPLRLQHVGPKRHHRAPSPNTEPYFRERLQQSPAAGRAVSELILDSGFQTIDLTALGFERVLRNEPVREKNVV